MNKRYIFLTILAFASVMHAKKNDAELAEATRSGSVIAATLYKPVTATSIKNGLIIDKPGSYVLAVPTTIPATGSNQETADIGAAAPTNGAIVIQANDVTLNLNGYSLKTEVNNLVAIYVNDDVSGTIIENGSIMSGSAQAWEAAIVVGEGCSDITIRDMNIHDCDNGGTYSAIDIRGTSGSAATHCKGVLLDNVKVFGYTGEGARSINCAYVDSLDLVDVRANSANVGGGAAHDGIKCSNCNNVSLRNVKADSNTVAGAQTGLNFDTCDGVVLDNVSASNNTPTAAFDGIRFITCNNIKVSNAATNNNAVGSTYNGFNLATCLNVQMNNVAASNNTGGSGVVYGLNLNACKNVEAVNVEVNSNGGTGGTAGLLLDTCNDMNFVNVLCANSADATNTLTMGVSMDTCLNVNFDHFTANNLAKAKSGIDFNGAASSNISFVNCSISNCDSGAAAFIGVNGVVGINGLNLVNCSLSNNTGTSTFDGVKLAAASKNVRIEGVDVLNNTASAGDFNGFNLANVDGVVVDRCKVEHNSEANAATNNLYGLQAASTVTNLSISNSSFSSNAATSDATTGKVVAGVSVTGASSNDNGLSIDNCQASNNTGAGCAYGFYVTLINNASITNCTANGNLAATVSGASTILDGVEALPSAGFRLYQCDYCTIDGCAAIGNKSGNYSRGVGGANESYLLASCSGFGFINHGLITLVGAFGSAGGADTYTPNIGNVFSNCVAHGNGTQLDETIDVADVGSYVVTGITGAPNDYRYALSEAIAGGFVDQSTQATEYFNCTANSNGLIVSVVSYGFLVMNLSTTVNITKCSASNNWYYGFVDGGAQQDTQVNSQTTLFANYACMNGEHNDAMNSILYNPPGTVAAGVTDGHLRNYWLYFSEEGQDIPIKKVAYGGQGMAQIPGNELFNISMAKDA